MQHADLAQGRWYTLSLVEQLANIGSELERALSAQERGLAHRSEAALGRTLELFDLTLASPNLSLAARREVARTRELVVDWFYGNSYQTTPAQWQRYFLPFAVAARTHAKSVKNLDI